jgi:hypothetical protein
MRQIDPSDLTLYALTSTELMRFSRGVALGLLEPPCSMIRRSGTEISVRFCSHREAERTKRYIS